MSNNCNKYQSIYVFRDSEEFQKHLDVCAICREKHLEILNIENIVKSSKPFYLKASLKNNAAKLNRSIACVAVLVFTSFVFNNYSELNAIPNRIKHPEISEFVNNSLFNQMELPTDKYGILDPHKELSYE